MLSTLVLVTGLGIGLYFQGGQAFSPGELSAMSNVERTLGGFVTHAEFESECDQCHQPFSGIQASLCEECHQDVAAERQSRRALHGKIAAAEECGRCHKDHRGKAADLVAMAYPYFDHTVTEFSLKQHDIDYSGISIDCAGCHGRDMTSDRLMEACADCHSANAPEQMALHTEAYGVDCVACHDGFDTVAQFSLDDHTRVFALTGAHAETTCEACHAGGNFNELPESCVGCHEEPAAHTGLFDTECARCHTDEGWSPAALDGAPFEHGQTRFALVSHRENFDGSPFACQECHGDSGFAFTQADCVVCHEPAQRDFIPEHIAAVGRACLNCHDGSGDLGAFDHGEVWPLEGEHDAVACIDCHSEAAESGEARDCVACHAEPQVHMGLFGIDCAACHTAAAWLPARLNRHAFPLDHGENREVACATCHPSSYPEYTCYECHEHNPQEIEREHEEEGISSAELADCVGCHPNGLKEEEEAAE